jgi:hypothetical protein
MPSLKTEIADLKEKVKRRYQRSKGWTPFARFSQIGPDLWANRFDPSEVGTLAEIRQVPNRRLILFTHPNFNKESDHG